MDRTQKKALIAIGGMTAYCVGVSYINFREQRKALKLMKKYNKKHEALGTVIELFEQLSEWIDQEGRDLEKEEFVQTFYEKAEYIGLACNALREDKPKPEEA